MKNKNDYYNNKKSSEIALAIGLIGGIITILTLIITNLIKYGI